MCLEEYMRFMEIDAFPVFETEYVKLDLEQENVIVAQAEFDFIEKKHKLRLPEKAEVPMFLLFHELTHIYDTSLHSKGEINYDYCLTGFLEYHASQVELLQLLGAKSIYDTDVCFSMNDYLNIGEEKESARTYITKKYDIAKSLLRDVSRENRENGAGVLFNYFGLVSICRMYATDFEEEIDVSELGDFFDPVLVVALEKMMSGWINDIDSVVALYSNVIFSVITKNITK